MAFDYQQSVIRNIGYVGSDIQEKVSQTRLVIAGCGIGSSLAEAAVRLGFRKFILIDGDVVDAHNLNRQDYVFDDIGTPKVSALARRIKAINPEADVQEVNALLAPDNAAELIGAGDIVFDTVDFLDISGIVAVHDAARELGKPIVTAMSIGWGAGCVYFPPGSPWTFRKLFGLPDSGSVDNASYVERFGAAISRLATVLDPEVVQVVGQALTVMEDGTPCPASQVSPGAFSVGAMAATLIVRVLAEQPVTEAPKMTLVDLPALLTGAGLDLS